MQADIDGGHTTDELELYMTEPVLRGIGIRTFDALKWWTEDAQQQRYPQLSKLAVDLLTIPAMSAGIERVFSECKFTCLRHATLSETLKEIHLLRSWLRSTVLDGVKLVSDSLQSHSTNKVQPNELRTELRDTQQAEAEPHDDQRDRDEIEETG